MEPKFKLRKAFERHKQTVRHGRYTPDEVTKVESKSNQKNDESRTV